MSTGTGNGTIAVNPVDNDTIVDAAGNPLGGAGTGATVSGPAYNVDKAPPTSTIATTGAYGAASWPGAIQGTADGTGKVPASVSLTIQRSSDGRFWDGSSFASSVAVPLAATLAGIDWSYAFALPAAGTYTVKTTAMDGVGNVQRSATTASFTVG